jgi:hypothetical protein
VITSQLTLRRGVRNKNRKKETNSGRVTFSFLPIVLCLQTHEHKNMLSPQQKNVTLYLGRLIYFHSPQFYPANRQLVSPGTRSALMRTGICCRDGASRARSFCLRGCDVQAGVLYARYAYEYTGPIRVFGRWKRVDLISTFCNLVVPYHLMSWEMIGSICDNQVCTFILFIKSWKCSLVTCK